jgi:hypothetical protein
MAIQLNLASHRNPTIIFVGFRLRGWNAALVNEALNPTYSNCRSPSERVDVIIWNRAAIPNNNKPAYNKNSLSIFRCK